MSNTNVNSKTDKYVATYLNDHLAGSVTVVDLLKHLEATHAGTELARFAAGLYADIEADRRELEGLIARLNIGESAPRQAVTWLAEKAIRLKLRLDDPAGGALRLLESLDIVAAGIDGKRALWLALAATAEDAPPFQGVDYARLEQRAEEQRGRVETVRREAARAALGAAASAASPPQGRPPGIIPA